MICREVKGAEFMGQTLLKNGYIVTMNETEQVYDGGSVLVQDDKILAAGKVDPKLVAPDDS